MIGETTGGELIAGHTGGGPGSAVAVYHRLDKPTGTAAAFEAGGTTRQSKRPALACWEQQS